jgi:hypothetical protein
MLSDRKVSFTPKLGLILLGKSAHQNLVFHSHLILCGRFELFSTMNNSHKKVTASKEQRINTRPKETTRKPLKESRQMQ